MLTINWAGIRTSHYGGLCMLNVKTIGSGDVCRWRLRELVGGGDPWSRPGGIVSRKIWRFLACPEGSQVWLDIENWQSANPALPGKMAVNTVSKMVCVLLLWVIIKCCDSIFKTKLMCWVWLLLAFSPFNVFLLFVEKFPKPPDMPPAPAPKG